MDDMDDIITKEEVLKKLIDSNDYVSGEMLAKEIGVSRASVWKAIKTLQKAGYDIEGVTKCGYKLNQNNKIVCGENLQIYNYIIFNSVSN